MSLKRISSLQDFVPKASFLLRKPSSRCQKKPRLMQFWLIGLPKHWSIIQNSASPILFFETIRSIAAQLAHRWESNKWKNEHWTYAITALIAVLAPYWSCCNAQEAPSSVQSDFRRRQSEKKNSVLTQQVCLAPSETRSLSLSLFLHSDVECSNQETTTKSTGYCLDWILQG